MIRRMFIPFEQFEPDKGNLANPGLIVADDCAPLGQSGFVPNPLVGIASEAIAGTGLVGGLHVAPFGGPVANADYQVFTGSDNSRLYRIAPTDFEGGSWGAADYTRLAGGAYTADDWHWTSFGEAVVAVPGLGDDPQILLPGAANFAKLVSGGSPDDPRARYVTGLRQRLILASIQLLGVDYPNRVWWSATNDIRTYGDSASLPSSRTNFEDLEDTYGPITAVISGTDYAHIFKRKASYRMNFGGPFGFSFIPVAVGHGTIYSHSVAVLGSRIFFWGPAGPTMINEGLEAVPLGPGSFSRSLQDESWFLETSIALKRSTTTQIYAAADPASELVFWLYDATDVDAATGRILFIYNARHGRGAIQRTWLSTAATPTFAPHAIALRPPQQTWPWSPLRDLLISGVEQSTPVVSKVAFFDPAREANSTFRTGFIELQVGVTTRVLGVRPIFSFNANNLGPEDFSVTLRSINKPWGTPIVAPITRDSMNDADENGFIRFPDSHFSRFWTFEAVSGGASLIQSLITDTGDAVVTDAGFGIEVFTANASRLAEIEGVEVEFVEGPEYAG